MKKVLLTIMDGVGLRDVTYGNAFNMASHKTLDYLMENYPNSKLEASGTMVGLPKGQMGNSEVGHMNIGAGRIVYQPLQLITKQIETKEILENENINEVINYSKQNNSKLHIMGLLSDGGIHSHIDHLMGIIDMCKEKNVKEIYFHLFLDGRDTLPHSSYSYIEKLEKKIQEVGIGKIITISGRYYAMDRDNNWDRVSKAYEAIVNGIGEEYNSVKEAIDTNYSKDITDEFIIPAVFDKLGLVSDNDGIILFNFRPDRVRELFTALTNPTFECFDRTILNNIKLVTMMPVSDNVICTNAFSNQNLENTLGEYLSKKGIKQLRIAETEKYAHVTYFFDGGIEKDLSNCKRILIPSPKVATYDLKPEMSAYEVTDRLLKEIDNYDFVVLNFANGDMVGHTGVLDKAIKAVEVVDDCISKLYQKCKEIDMTMVIIADHGNCDWMLDNNDNVITSHSTSLVPFIITDKKYQVKDGKLGDVAPTILNVMDLDIPDEMSGEVITKCI